MRRVGPGVATEKGAIGAHRPQGQVIGLRHRRPVGFIGLCSEAGIFRQHALVHVAQPAQRLQSVGRAQQRQRLGAPARARHCPRPHHGHDQGIRSGHVQAVEPLLGGGHSAGLEFLHRKQQVGHGHVAAAFGESLGQCQRSGDAPVAELQQKGAPEDVLVVRRGDQDLVHVVGGARHVAQDLRVPAGEELTRDRRADIDLRARLRGLAPHLVTGVGKAPEQRLSDLLRLGAGRRQRQAQDQRNPRRCPWQERRVSVRH